ncbi:WD40-repeat-containing domain protein [Cokeromyces recurvatus]|uniref:WD40-repeat-containing domain protein n=1 Tax=Cokeromyces recurvatus TaxID=90255 RepID=UPI00221F0334|nr:WD40-repeat-containing domain protein [Cokeromyces recurvatus]KAI7899292.1 WD40-repeat-containing domain protein [Cokeromyces recurvatus]
MAFTPYKLESTLKSHEQDVKAVVALSNDTIISASRDKTVRSWIRTGSNAFSPEHIYLGHGHFVNALAIIKPNQTYPQGLIVSGGSDKYIHVYDPNQPSEPRFILIGHTENVCALATTPSGHIISGSWDNKIIVWKEFQQAYVLEGHSAAIWAVLAIDDDLILTASADKTIRLWKNGKLVHVYQGHTQAVRGLALVPGIGFVSCSNDGTLRVWTLEGECIQQLDGHTSFVYSVNLLSTGEFVSSGEDRTVRIWKDGQCVQTLQQPCISVWTVSVSPNDDIVVGGSDATIRVYTKDPERMASPEALKEFDELLASQAIPSNQIGDLNKEKLPGPEALNKSGSKEGQVIMVNMGSTVEAHQWSMQSQSWQKIGEVVGSSGSSKQTYEGKEYDYVFDIDVGEGPNGKLKLPYNVTQNPYDAAQKFLTRHDLPMSYIDQVTDFIIKNTEGVNLGGGYQDPFTGANRYTPQSANQSTPEANYIDPYTGGASYRPGTSTTFGSTASNYADPFTGSKSYRPLDSNTPTSVPSFQQPKVLPVKTYLVLKQANPDAVLNKIRSLNEEMNNCKLLEEELTSLGTAISFLKNPIAGSASFNGSTGLSAVVKMAKQWPIDKRFPALDLIRLFTLYSPEALASAVPEENLPKFLIDVGGLSPDNTTQTNETNAMLAYRGLANLFNFEAGRTMVWNQRNIVSDIMQMDISGKFKGKNSRLAQSTLAVK